MRNANGENFYTDSYVVNEKRESLKREFLVPARTTIGHKLLNLKQHINFLVFGGKKN
jgi:hypothetical protein